MKTRQGVDFLLLCPLGLEVDALVHEVGRLGKLAKKMTGSEIYVIPRADGLVARVQLKKLPHQGNLFSGISTAELLRAMTNCRYIVSFGIAGTIDRNALQIGDVLVPREVIYYEFSREQDAEAAERPVSYTCTPPESALATLQTTLEENPGDFSVVLNRSLASGEKLFDKQDSELVQRIRDMNDNLSSVDMEAAGVAAAIRAISPNTHFFAVKGISDNADGTKKDGPDAERDKNRRRAAKNAAFVLAEIINSVIQDVAFEPASSASIYNLDRRGGTDQTQNFTQIVKPIPWITDPANPRETLSFAKAHIFTNNRRPPIFYHWRQDSTRIHLVDLIFYAVLAHLKSHHYPIHALITDSSTMSDAERQALRKMLKNWCDAQVSFLTEARSRERTRSESHADSTSLVPFFSDNIDELIERNRYQKPSNTVTSVRFWLNYIPYICRHRYDSAAAVLLCWHRHLSIYKAVLDCHLDFYPALLSTPDINANGSPLKFWEQTKDLKVRAADILSFANCLKNIKSLEDLHQIRAHLVNVQALNLGERLSDFLASLDGYLNVEIEKRRSA